MTRAAIRWIAVSCVVAALSCCGRDAVKSAPAPVPPAKPATRTTAPKPGKITRLSLDAFFPLQQGNAALIYDVRPALFYGFGHIPGAVSWPKHAFEAQLPTREAEIRAAIAAKRTIVLYCTDLACPDSNKVATRLAALGYPVSILEGGYAAWKAAELPSE